MRASAIIMPVLLVSVGCATQAHNLTPQMRLIGSSRVAPTELEAPLAEDVVVFEVALHTGKGVRLAGALENGDWLQLEHVTDCDSMGSVGLMDPTRAASSPSAVFAIGPDSDVRLTVRRLVPLRPGTQLPPCIKGKVRLVTLDGPLPEVDFVVRRPVE